MKPALKQTADWNLVSLAQHQAGLLQDDQDKMYNMINKQKYKEELDEQIKMNQRLNKSSEGLKKLELDYYAAQQLKYKNLDSQAKKEHKKYIQAFQLQNIEALQNKKNEYERFIIEDKKESLNIIQQEKQLIEEQKKLEQIRKQQRINEEQAEHARLVNENKAKQRLAELEKLREKSLINKKILEMQESETKHTHFIHQKFQNFENRLQKVTENFPASNNKELLIQRRQIEHEAYLKAKELEENSLKSAKKQKEIKSLREGLDDQILQKYSVQRMERDQDRKYLESLKQEAAKDIYYHNLQNFTKKLEKEKIREDYNKQLQEKRSNSVSKFQMNDKEKLLNYKLLEKIGQGQASFPSVPGLNPNHSPAKLSFERIYSKQRLKRENERSESVKAGLARNQIYWVAEERHNPITNPIGYSNPKVLPGQRLFKGQRPDKRQEFSIKDLLYQN